MTRHRKPRILYVTPFWPHRAGIGAEVRSRQVLEALRGMGDVEVVVLQDANGRAGSAPDAVTATVMDTVNVMSRPTNGLAAKVRWMFAARLQYPHGCGVESGGAERVLRAANDFDLLTGVGSIHGARSADCLAARSGPASRWGVAG